MEIIIIIIVSASASLITLFSGFGLGTILTPVFALFFPVTTAVALTGIVHLFNNLFKLTLFGRHTDRKVIFSFGIPSMAGAVLGAVTLLMVSELQPLAEYSVLGRTAVIHPVKLIIAMLMFYFSMTELFPLFQSFKPSKISLPFGGLLSGFFGGLSGHQGALRSAFLIRYGLSKEQFLATGIVIACCVDVTRLSLYSERLLSTDTLRHWDILLAAVLAAFAGAYAGNAFLKKITIASVQRIVAVMLLIIAAGLAAGLI